MSEYQKPTDEAHQVKLTSKLVHALWISRAVCVGEKAPFEVWTHFVGNGAAIQVEVFDRKGKKIEKIKGKVYGNYFSAAVTIPEKARDGLMFTARLPKHNLEKNSDVCRILPPVKISSQKWSQKEARRSDVVKLSADVENIPDGAQVMITIYEFDPDGAHDFITKFPCRIHSSKIDVQWRYEYHADTDHIPTDEEMKKHGKSYSLPEYFWVAEYGRKRFGDNRESGLLTFKDWITIELKNDQLEPYPEEKYEISFADGSKKTGQLNDEGSATIENVPPGKVKVDYPDL